MPYTHILTHTMYKIEYRDIKRFIPKRDISKYVHRLFKLFHANIHDE